MKYKLIIITIFLASSLEAIRWSNQGGSRGGSSRGSSSFSGRSRSHSPTRHTPTRHVNVYTPQSSSGKHINVYTPTGSSGKHINVYGGSKSWGSGGKFINKGWGKNWTWKWKPSISYSGPVGTEVIDTTIDEEPIESDFDSQMFANKAVTTPEPETTDGGILKAPKEPITDETRNALNKALTKAFKDDPKFKENLFLFLQKPYYKKNFGPVLRDEGSAQNMIRFLDNGYFQKKVNDIMTPESPIDVLEKILKK